MEDEKKEQQSMQIRLEFRIRRDLKKKFEELCLIEDTYPNKMFEKLVLAYKPTPVEKNPEGKFIACPTWNYHKQKMWKPDCVVVCLNTDKRLCPQKDLVVDLREGKITLEEFKEYYKERLKQPDAQARIKELKRYVKHKYVFLTDTYGVNDENKSLRKVFYDALMNGEI